MKKVVFLDRDGVINIDKSYVYKIDDFEFTKDLIKVLKHFLKLDYTLIIVTNQSGIGRGFYKLEDFKKLTKWMLEELKKFNIEIKKVYFCPHDPKEQCECRKPHPKMLLEAANEFNIDLTNSWMIGDKESDIEAAINAGINNTIFIGNKKTKAKFKVKSILDTIAIIKS